MDRDAEGWVQAPAPAKLNLFLHVVGRRPDGYHLLESLFRLLDWGDVLRFRVREDGALVRHGGAPGVAADDDLTIRAARLLREAGGAVLGADIAVRKAIPLGGGLGGGSSDAASTLMVLNRLWGCGLDRRALMALGLKLGADVPFFIGGEEAFVQGIGERLQPLCLPEAWYVVLHPGIGVPTEQIFRDPLLTRNTPFVKMADFAARKECFTLSAPQCKQLFSTTRNDLETVAKRRYPEIAEALSWLSQFGVARMTGSGACVFVEVGSGERAADIAAKCPGKWCAWGVRSMQEHPLRWI